MNKQFSTPLTITLTILSLLLLIGDIGLNLYFAFTQQPTWLSVFINIASMLIIYLSFSLFRLHPNLVCIFIPMTEKNGHCADKLFCWTRLLLCISIFITELADIFLYTLPSWYPVCILLIVLAEIFYFTYRMYIENK